MIFVRKFCGFSSFCMAGLCFLLLVLVNLFKRKDYRPRGEVRRGRKNANVGTFQVYIVFKLL